MPAPRKAIYTRPLAASDKPRRIGRCKCSRAGSGPWTGTTGQGKTRHVFSKVVLLVRRARSVRTWLLAVASRPEERPSLPAWSTTARAGPSCSFIISIKEFASDFSSLFFLHLMSLARRCMVVSGYYMYLMSLARKEMCLEPKSAHRRRQSGRLRAPPPFFFFASGWRARLGCPSIYYQYSEELDQTVVGRKGHYASNKINPGRNQRNIHFIVPTDKNKIQVKTESHSMRPHAPHFCAFPKQTKLWTPTYCMGMAKQATTTLVRPS